MKVVRRDLGYLQVDPIPSIDDLREHYQNKYYQQCHGSYENSYSEMELKWKCFQEWLIIKSLDNLGVTGSALDIGCGEGYLLSALGEFGFDAHGIDYSNYGLKKENPHLLQYFTQADVMEYVENCEAIREYDVISLLNVIEHVRDPESLLSLLKKKIKKTAILVIRFPNDNSKLHDYVCRHTETPSAWWLTAPDHISYFNHDSMARTLDFLGYEVVAKVADHSIDFNLLNQNSNYIIDRDKGKATHQARMLIDNFLFDIDKNKYFSILEEFADMGVGRNLTFFAKLKEV